MQRRSSPASTMTQENGRLSSSLPFLLLVRRGAYLATLKRVLQPELNLAVSVNRRSDVHEVRVRDAVGVQTATRVREQIRVVEHIEEFHAQRQRLPFTEPERPLHAGVVE